MRNSFRIYITYDRNVHIQHEGFKSLPFLILLMGDSNKLPSYLRDRYGKNVTKYDVPLLMNIAGQKCEKTTKQIMEEPKKDQEEYLNFLEAAYEKDKIKTVDYLLEKELMGTQDLYGRLKALIADAGMSSDNPNKVQDCIEMWENLNEKLKMRYGIKIDEFHPHSCIITDKKRLSVSELLTKHKEELKPSQK